MELPIIIVKLFATIAVFTLIGAAFMACEAAYRRLRRG